MISTNIQIRFADVDLAGHVHNAAYLHYFETGRMHFLVQGLGKEWDWKQNGLILKKNIIEYLHPVKLSDDLRIDVWCSHIGRTSFTLSYNVCVGQVIHATGDSVLVCFNYSENSVTAMPGQLLNHLNRHLSALRHGS